jgi:hypothetical protein
MLLPTVLLGVLTLRVCASAYPSTYKTPIPYNVASDLDFLRNYQEKYELFIRFADAFMYPNNTAQADMINSTLFAESVQGRVDMTTTFDGRELNTEVKRILRLC